MYKGKGTNISNPKHNIASSDIPCDAKNLIVKINAWFSHNFRILSGDKLGDYHCTNPGCALKIRIITFGGNPMLLLIEAGAKHPLRSIRDFKIPECGAQKIIEENFCHEGHSYQFIEDWD